VILGGAFLREENTVIHMFSYIVFQYVKHSRGHIILPHYKWQRVKCHAVNIAGL